MKKNSVLVIGGAGFIGSNLCRGLLEEGGYDVYSLDNYHTGHADNHIDNVKYIKGNSDEIDLKINFSPDIIFHFGEYSRVEQSFDDIDLVWEYNMKGTYAVLKFVRKTGAKLVYAGSSTKFADSGEGKMQSPYGFSKSSNTELVVAFGKWFNINFAICYFYNAYGPGEISSGKYATLIGIFTSQYKKNLPLTVVKPGTQKRNFTHVYDIVSGLLLIAKNGYGDGFGLGSDTAYTVDEIAQCFECEVQYISERQGNRMDADLVTDKTKELGWSPDHDVKQFIGNIIGKPQC
ncbi:NAD-dependent epimerase/dehydratase family protein [Gammaproteobacteria bacterium]|nr:NAD-dependent epimerase/dehydratase family protein [Gammaproteobacteria bacterium]MDC0511107.1 NAD-dependent epimerase/dehydratase family protein [bacterium]